MRDRNDAKTGWQNSEGFSYDKANNGSGRYGEQRYSQSYTEDRGRVQTYTLGWDEFGMPTNLRVRVIDSGNSQTARFNTTIDYGAAGQVVSQRLPGGKGGQLGETITYSYDSRTGRPTAATVNEGVGQIAGNIELNEFGQLLSMDNLSGVKRGYTYERGTGRLLQVQAGTDTANVLNSSYSYDPNGNVTTLTDATNAGQQTCYGYDHVQRLTSAATSGFGTCGTAGQTLGAGGFEHAYSYDAIGNMTSYGTADRAYTYDPNRPHAVVSIANPQDPAQGDWTYAYDDGGNVTQRQVEGWDQTFSYDQQQRVVQIDDVAINGVGNTATTTFAYTAGDSRVVRDTDEAQTFYAFGVYEYEIDKATDARTERSTYAVAGERVAVRSQVSNPASDELTWTFADNLGSASGFLNETTGETGAQRYYPFGHQRVGSATDVNPTDHGYTGQIRDGATGVYFYNARYYDQHTGRFLAADTIIPNPANPADLNRYSYVNNNPINYNDPTGHCGVPGASSADDCTSHFTLVRQENDRARQQSSNPTFGYNGSSGSSAGPCVSTFSYTDTSGCGANAGQDCDAGCAYGRVETVASFGPVTGEIIDIKECFSGIGWNWGTGFDCGAIFLPFVSSKIDDIAEVAIDSRRLSNCFASFSGDTEVLMADGTTRPIAEIVLGEYVWAHDPESGETGAREVIGVWPHKDLLLEYVIGEGSVITTEDHHFWNVTDDEWQETRHIDEGDYLLTADGDVIEAGNLDWSTARHADAYDLTIEQIHTYFVSTGNEVVLVHNTDDPCEALMAGFGEDFSRALSDIDSGAVRHSVPNSQRFANDGRDKSQVLQTHDHSGREIIYTEHYVNPRPAGGSQDGRRIVTGSDGSVYLTVNHYRSFTQIR